MIKHSEPYFLSLFNRYKIAASLFLGVIGLCYSIGVLAQEIYMGSGDSQVIQAQGNDSNLLIVFYVQIMPDDFVMQLHRF